MGLQKTASPTKTQLIILRMETLTAALERSLLLSKRHQTDTCPPTPTTSTRTSPTPTAPLPVRCLRPLPTQAQMPQGTTLQRLAPPTAATLGTTSAASTQTATSTATTTAEERETDYIKATGREPILTLTATCYRESRSKPYDYPDEPLTVIIASYRRRMTKMRTPTARHHLFKLFISNFHSLHCHSLTS